MAENPAPQDGTPIDVEDVLAGFQTEVARLTRRAILSEVEVRILRAQVQQHLARIADLEQQVSTDTALDVT